MSGTDDFLRGLDDPAGTPSRLPAIDEVISRGRHIRTRRYALASGSAAALCTAIAVAAFGVVPGISAARSSDGVTPATQPSATTTASVTAAPHKHGGTQVLVAAPGTTPHRLAPTHSPSPVPTSAPVTDPCTQPSPVAPDPSATSQPSPVASDGSASDSCTSPSPDSSASPTDSPSATPVDTPAVSATPAVQGTPGS